MGAWGMFPWGGGGLPPRSRGHRGSRIKAAGGDGDKPRAPRRPAKRPPRRGDEYAPPPVYGPPQLPERPLAVRMLSNILKSPLYPGSQRPPPPRAVVRRTRVTVNGVPARPSRVAAGPVGQRAPLVKPPTPAQKPGGAMTGAPEPPARQSRTRFIQQMEQMSTRVRGAGERGARASPTAQATQRLRVSERMEADAMSEVDRGAVQWVLFMNATLIWMFGRSLYFMIPEWWEVRKLRLKSDAYLQRRRQDMARLVQLRDQARVYEKRPKGGIQVYFVWPPEEKPIFYGWGWRNRLRARVETAARAWWAKRERGLMGVPWVARRRLAAMPDNTPYDPNGDGPGSKRKPPKRGRFYWPRPEPANVEPRPPRPQWVGVGAGGFYVPPEDPAEDPTYRGGLPPWATGESQWEPPPKAVDDLMDRLGARQGPPRPIHRLLTKWAKDGRPKAPPQPVKPWSTPKPSDLYTPAEGQWEGESLSRPQPDAGAGTGGGGEGGDEDDVEGELVEDLDQLFEERRRAGRGRRNKRSRLRRD